MAGTDDLAPLLIGQSDGRVVIGQATITAWSPSDNVNTVNFRGTSIPNVTVMHGVSALGYEPGDVVILLGWIPKGKRSGSWWILGRALIPGEDSPDLVVRGSSIRVEGGGDVLIQAEGGLQISDGGGVDVNDGGFIRARHANGVTALKFGTLTDELTGDPSGHGLLVQDDDNTDIFRAKRDETGTTIVEAGAAGQLIDEFNVGALQAALISDEATPIGVVCNSTDVVVATPSTTGSAANVHLSGTTEGVISRVTSARRYKQGITDLHVNPRTILDLKPRTWRDIGEVERHPETDRWHVGYIAEELDEIGLGAFVDYDDQGRPDSIEYERLILPLVEQVKALTTWAESQGFQQTAVVATPLPKRKPGEREPVIAKRLKDRAD